MTLYPLALFIHFAGLIVLFSAFFLHMRGDIELRRATTMEQAQPCIALLKSSGPMFPIGSSLLFLSGVYMSSAQWSFSTPWVSVGIVAVIAMSVVGGIVGGRHGESVKAHSTQIRGPIPSEFDVVIRQRRPQIMSLALGGGALGIVWIMAAKSGWTGSIVAVLGGYVVGAFAGAITTGRSDAVIDGRRGGGGQ